MNKNISSTLALSLLLFIHSSHPIANALGSTLEPEDKTMDVVPDGVLMSPLFFRKTLEICEDLKALIGVSIRMPAAPNSNNVPMVGLLFYGEVIFLTSNHDQSFRNMKVTSHRAFHKIIELQSTDNMVMGPMTVVSHGVHGETERLCSAKLALKNGKSWGSLRNFQHFEDDVDIHVECE